MKIGLRVELDFEVSDFKRVLLFKVYLHVFKVSSRRHLKLFKVIGNLSQFGFQAFILLFSPLNGRIETCDRYVFILDLEL